MSGFNPSIPAGAEHNGANPTLLFDGNNYEYERSTITNTIFSSQTASATVTGIDIDNVNFCGGLFFLNLTSRPASGSTTIALIIQYKDPVSENYVSMFTSAQVSGTSTTVVQVCPGTSASANGIAAALPRTFRVLAAISAGATSKDVVFSVGMSFVRT